MVDNIASTVTTIYRESGKIYVVMPIINESDEGEQGAFASVPVKGVPFSGRFTNDVFFLDKPVNDVYFKKLSVLAKESHTFTITPDDYERAAILIYAGLVNGPISTTALSTQSIACADIIGVLTNNILAKAFPTQSVLSNLLRQQGQKLVDAIAPNCT